jgi:EAL domain-containing protein (putative c-di-GMP-specific phosphodiesterase class I)
VLLDGVHDRSEAAVAAERILAAVAAPLGSAGTRGPTVRASIGVALQTSVAETGAELLKAADAAMYTAKGRGGGRVEFFDPDRDRGSRPHAEEERDLARAAERGELTLHFQPEIDVGSGEVVAVEALVRWMHPDRGLLRPADFLSDAERNGHIVAIDEWVVGTACAQAVAWSGEGLGQFRIAVNVSDAHVRQPAFEDSVRRRLDDAGLPAARLELEISERALADPGHPSRSAMHRLRAAGTRVNIDHYGTAETTSATLDALPVDAVKLDGRFVRSLPADGEKALDLIESAHARGFEVIAGGVETAGQLTMLRNGGCDVAAGHLICHPMTARELSTWLARRKGG